MSKHKFNILSAMLVIGGLGLTSDGLIAAEIQNRKALIIGNAEYADSAALVNPVNDAMLVDDALKAKGFETTLVVNAGRKEMKLALREFNRTLEAGSVGLFYYAGHAVEVNGENYLVPVGADISDESEVEFETINAGRVLAGMESARDGLNLVILDACRNNPFGDSFRSYGSRGLKPMRPLVGSAVIYSTEPGSVAADNPEDSNSLFTRKLVESMNESGSKLEEVFKKTAISVRQESKKQQTPYMEGVILGDFYFTPNDGELVAAISRKKPIDSVIFPEPKTNVAITQPRDSSFPFTVNTNPKNSRIRVLNIIPKYRAGMDLSAGNYTVEVTATGYDKKVVVVNHAEGAKPLVISLRKSKVVAAVPKTAATEAQRWQEASAQNTINAYKAYLKDFPNGTYAFIANTRLRKMR